MQSVIQGFISQSSKMDPLERLRRLKRSFESNLSFRKLVILALFGFAFILYVGPTIFSWLFGSPRVHISSPSCINDKLIQHTSDLAFFNAHIKHRPLRGGDSDYLPYVGNGHFGVSMTEAGQEMFVAARGQSRTLGVPVSFQPIVQVTNRNGGGDSHSAKVVNYVKGLVHEVVCYDYGQDDYNDLSVSRQVYAHRAIPEVLVQEIKISNPTAEDQTFILDRPGASASWKSAQTSTKQIQQGDGDKQYLVVSGVVPVPPNFETKVPTTDVVMVAIAVPKLADSISVQARMTQTLSLLSAVAYSKPLAPGLAADQRSQVEAEAVEAIKQAAGRRDLRELHVKVWQQLWTTGFAISHSMAEESVNGAQVNATIYYVLSQVPTPLHSVHAVDLARKTELQSHLAYLEGCYGGLPTLHANNLWKSLNSQDNVNTLVNLWILTLEKNGCHKLIKAGADGVVQAMVLSFAGLAFRQQHLELNSHPKDMHRDYMMRRVSYGNSTHLNISVLVGNDNKAFLEVALDRRDKDYFACDAGCLDPPVQLSTTAKMFPVKLTDPVTAVLYITSDYQHMQELKHTIHVSQVNDAPPHEHHVIALHRHGNKLGGLPTIFWFSVAFLIIVFHGFLFKLIWQEYCAGGDRFRARKFSDYQ